MVPDGEVPGPDPQQVVEVELYDEPALGVNLGEHGLPVLRHHRGLVAVQGHRGL